MEILAVGKGFGVTVVSKLTVPIENSDQWEHDFLMAVLPGGNLKLEATARPYSSHAAGATELLYLSHRIVTRF